MKRAKHLLGAIIASVIILVPSFASQAAGDAPPNRDLHVEIVEKVLTKRMTKAQGAEVQDTAYAIVGTCEDLGIDPLFVLAVIDAESNFDIEAISPMGARGLMQLLPKTFAAMSDSKRTFIPTDNVVAGIRYLGHLRELGFKTDKQLLLAYNAGPGTAFKVNKKLRPYPDESRKYIPTVLDKYQKRYLPLRPQAVASAE